MTTGAVAIAAAVGQDAPAPVRCEIGATYEAATRRIAGRERLVWTNTSGESTDEVRLQLPWNAWRGRRSAWMRALPASRRAAFPDEAFGAIDLVTVARVEDGERRPLTWEFVAVDARAPEDRTVARIPLEAAVAPGEEVELAIDFVATAPDARYAGVGVLPGGTLVAIGWCPRLGRLAQEARPEGGTRSVWRCPPFVARASRPAVAIDFDVRIDVPGDRILAATGGAPVELADAEGRRRARFRAKDVADFGWVAGAGLVTHEVVLPSVAAADDATARAVAAVFDRDVGTFDLPSTPLRVLLPPTADESVRDRWVRALDDWRRRFVVRTGFDAGVATIVDLGFDHGGEPRVPAARAGDLFLGAEPTAIGTAAAWISAAPIRLDRAAGLASFATAAGARADGLGVVRTDYGALTLERAPVSGLEPMALILPLRMPLPGWLAPGGPFEAGPLASWLVDARGTFVPDARWLAFVIDQPLAGFARRAAAPKLRLAAWADEALRATDGSGPPDRVGGALTLVEHAVGTVPFHASLRRFRAQLAAPAGRDDLVAWFEDDFGVGPADLFRAAIEPGATLDHGIDRVDVDPGGLGQAVVLRRDGDLRIDVRVVCTFAGAAEPVVRIYPASEPRRRLRIDLPVDVHGELVAVRLESTGGVPLDGDATDDAWRREPDRRPALGRALRLLPQVQWRLLSVGVGG